MSVFRINWYEWITKTEFYEWVFLMDSTCALTISFSGFFFISKTQKLQSLVVYSKYVEECWLASQWKLTFSKKKNRKSTTLRLIESYEMYSRRRKSWQLANFNNKNPRFFISFHCINTVCLNECRIERVLRHSITGLCLSKNIHNNSDNNLLWIDLHYFDQSCMDIWTKSLHKNVVSISLFFCGSRYSKFSVNSQNFPKFSVTE